MVSTHKMDWDRQLPSVVHTYNTSKKKTIGKSPYFLVFGQTVLHGIEMEVETLRVMAARSGNWIQDSIYWMIAVQDLEKAREEALEQTMKVQAKKKEDFDTKLPKDHGIQTGGMELFYDNRHEDFPSKLHTRWMGPYKVIKNFQNGSLQLEDLQGNWLDTRVNGSRIKQYQLESSLDDDPEFG